MTEKDLLRDTVRRLNAAGVPYMLTGSMASNYWGIPRTTHDLDFVVNLRPGDSATLTKAFSGDFFLDQDAIRAASRPPYQFNAIDLRSSLKVDFWLLRSSAFEQTMFGRRIQVPIFGEATWICSAEDVILHKLLWDRISPSERQRADVSGVIAVQGVGLDREYMMSWANKIGVQELFKDLLEGKIRPKTT